MDKVIFSVITPTHNRAHLIRRAYNSLLRQSYKGFIWYVLDDGSIDNTESVVKELQEEGLINIEYRYIPNGFTYKAMKLAAEIVSTPYIVRIDDDDELLDNCLEAFKEEWETIEREGLVDIGEIRALAKKDDGSVAGNYQPTIGQHPLDTTYLYQNFYERKELENVCCRKTEVWRQLFLESDEKLWLFDKITYFDEQINWNRLSRICKTRYIFVFLRLYHETKGESITTSVSKLTKQNVINKVFNRYVLLNELRDYYFIWPSRMIRFLATYVTYGMALHLRGKDMYNALASPISRFFYVLISPICKVMSIRVRSKISDI